MARKITIQHLYTTSGTTAPSDLINGEIAISHATGSEAIFIKERAEAGKTPVEIKFIPEVRIKKMFEEAGIGSNDVITGLSKQLSDHIDVSGDTSGFGHVKLVSGDVQSKTGYTIGEAAAAYHTHGQYLEEDSLSTTAGFQMFPGLNGGSNSYGVKAGTGITVDTNGVSISEEYQTNITNGATAYTWGNHANAGYAKNTDLTTLKNSVTAHTGNTEIHVTADDKNKWNKAKSDIDAFMIAADSGNTALDTLKEIQDFLTSDDGTVQTLLENLSALTDTVSGNTNEINDLKDEFKTNGTVGILETNVMRKVEEIEISGISLNVSSGTTAVGGNKKYTITHTAAGTKASEIIALNSTTGLSHGSQFTIIDNIAYDANGHVVSGSTKTLSLPNLPTATEELGGIVKLRSGLLTLEDEFLNENKDYLTTAASVAHAHSEYVKYTDLNNYEGTTPLVISCGTY